VGQVARQVARIRENLPENAPARIGSAGKPHTSILLELSLKRMPRCHLTYARAIS